MYSLQIKKNGILDIYSQRNHCKTNRLIHVVSNIISENKYSIMTILSIYLTSYFR